MWNQTCNLTPRMRARDKGKHFHKPNRGFSTLELAVVVTIVVIVAAMAIPIFSSIEQNLKGDGQMQSLRSALVQAKTRSAATFSRARLRANTSAQTFQMELWDKTTSTWKLEGGVQTLPGGVTFGYGSISGPPPSTQSTINQAAACTDDAGSTISNTACIIFNSRGIPVDSTGTALTTGDAIYITDGAAVHAVTVGRTGLIQGWRRDLTGSSAWKGN
jgi:Tfp pilus assembly protein FimT